MHQRAMNSSRFPLCLRSSSHAEGSYPGLEDTWLLMSGSPLRQGLQGSWKLKVKA